LIELKNLLKTTFYIILANLLLAIAASAFIIPFNFISSGATGLSLILQHFTALPLELGIYSINSIMFVIGAFVLGKKFAISTITSTILYPLFFSILSRFDVLQNITDDYLLAAIFAGILIGIGIGLVIKQGSSTGGMDIPPIIINKYTGIRLSILIPLFDILVLLGQILFFESQSILYGIFVVAISAVTLDKVMLVGQKKTQVLVISPKHQEIGDQVQTQLNRGVTYIHITKGYSKHDGKALLSIISSRQLFKLETIINQIDPVAFTIISEVHQVKGRGFNLEDDFML